MASFIFRPFQVTIKCLNRGLKLFKHERKVFEKSPLLHSLEIYEEQDALFPLTAADLAYGAEVIMCCHVKEAKMPSFITIAICGGYIHKMTGLRA